MQTVCAAAPAGKLGRHPGAVKGGLPAHCRQAAGRQSSFEQHRPAAQPQRRCHPPTTSLWGGCTAALNLVYQGWHPSQLAPSPCSPVADSAAGPQQRRQGLSGLALGRLAPHAHTASARCSHRGGAVLRPQLGPPQRPQQTAACAHQPHGGQSSILSQPPAAGRTAGSAGCWLPGRPWCLGRVRGHAPSALPAGRVWLWPPAWGTPARPAAASAPRG